MEAHTMEMKWYGPYKWYGKGEDSFFNTENKEEIIKESGIYLLTIPFESEYLTYYVGETRRPFVERFKEHTRYYLSGHYRVYDPREFAKGKTQTLKWGGTWKPERQDPKYMLEFLNKYSELSTVIYKFLGRLRIFIAPLKTDDRVLKRIESAIVARLRDQKSLMEEDDTVKYTLDRGLRPGEEPISVTMTSFEPILGLCSKLEA